MGNDAWDFCNPENELKHIYRLIFIIQWKRVEYTLTESDNSNSDN